MRSHGPREETAWRRQVSDRTTSPGAAPRDLPAFGGSRIPGPPRDALEAGEVGRARARRKPLPSAAGDGPDRALSARLQIPARPPYIPRVSLPDAAAGERRRPASLFSPVILRGTPREPWGRRQRVSRTADRASRLRRQRFRPRGGSEAAAAPGSWHRPPVTSCGPPARARAGRERNACAAHSRFDRIRSRSARQLWPDPVRAAASDGTRAVREETECRSARRSFSGTTSVRRP